MMLNPRMDSFAFNEIVTRLARPADEIRDGMGERAKTRCRAD